MAYLKGQVAKLPTPLREIVPAIAKEIANPPLQIFKGPLPLFDEKTKRGYRGPGWQLDF